MCLHSSVNSPIENDNVVEENRILQKDYDDALKVFLAYKKNVDASVKAGTRAPTPPKHPKTKAVEKGPPNKPKLKIMILMCMCRNSQSIAPNLDCGSSCFIKCIKEKILTCERGVARTGSETNLQGSIPCDTAGARKPDLAVGISNGYRSFARGTLKSMSSRKGVIEKGRGFDSPQSPVIDPSSCPLFGTQRTFPDVTANLYSS